MGVDIEKIFKSKRSKYSKVWYIFYMYMGPTGLIHDVVNLIDSQSPAFRGWLYLRFMPMFHPEEYYKYGPTNVAGFLPHQWPAPFYSEVSEEMNSTVRKSVIDFLRANLPDSLDPDSLEVVITPYPEDGYATATLEYEAYDFYADFSDFLIY